MTINHVSLGVSDLDKSAAFYDAVLGELGYTRQHEVEGITLAYGEQWPEVWITLPLDTEHPASGGNGTHIAFTAESPAAVDAFHRVAMAMGAQDDGTPGLRPDYGPTYYGAFVLDLDGNKIEACYFEVGA